MSEKPEIQQIPIDPNGRYLLVVKGLSQAAFKPIAERLKAWQESGDSVCLVSLGPDADFEFVRVDDKQAERSEQDLEYQEKFHILPL